MKPVYSVCINDDYRAVGLLRGSEVIWFWIGKHQDYERLSKQLEGVREFHSVGNALRGVPQSKPAATKIGRNGTEAVPYKAITVSEFPDALKQH